MSVRHIELDVEPDEQRATYNKLEIEHEDWEKKFREILWDGTCVWLEIIVKGRRYITSLFWEEKENKGRKGNRLIVKETEAKGWVGGKGILNVEKDTDTN